MKGKNFIFASSSKKKATKSLDWDPMKVYSYLKKSIGARPEERYYLAWKFTGKFYDEPAKLDRKVFNHIKKNIDQPIYKIITDAIYLIEGGR